MGYGTSRRRCGLHVSRVCLATAASVDEVETRRSAEGAAGYGKLRVMVNGWLVMVDSG